MSERIAIPNGMLRPMPQPALLGFSINDFTPDSYLWKRDGEVIVSLIMSRKPGSGAFGRLVRAIEANGLKVAVPTPLGRMEDILKRWGFAPSFETDEHYPEPVEVWRRA